MCVLGTAGVLLSAMQVYRRDRARNTFAAVSQKFSSIIVSVVALISGLFDILILMEAIFTHEVKSTKMQYDGSSTWTTENLETFYKVVSFGMLSHIYYSSGSISVFFHNRSAGGQCEE